MKQEAEEEGRRKGREGGGVRGGGGKGGVRGGGGEKGEERRKEGGDKIFTGKLWFRYDTVGGGRLVKGASI